MNKKLAVGIIVFLFAVLAGLVAANALKETSFGGAKTAFVETK